MNLGFVQSNSNLPLYLVMAQGYQLLQILKLKIPSITPTTSVDRQGIGDSIQFCRYLLLLKQFGIPFVYQTREPLVSLMCNWLGLHDSIVVTKTDDHV